MSKKVHPWRKRHRNGKFRGRCAYKLCNRLFWSKYEAAKYCPKTNHKWLEYDRQHPRKGIGHVGNKEAA